MHPAKSRVYSVAHVRQRALRVTPRHSSELALTGQRGLCVFENAESSMTYRQCLTIGGDGKQASSAAHKAGGCSSIRQGCSYATRPMPLLPGALPQSTVQIMQPRIEGATLLLDVLLTNVAIYVHYVRVHLSMYGGGIV